MGGMRPPPALLLLALAGCSDATPASRSDSGSPGDVAVPDAAQVDAPGLDGAMADKPVDVSPVGVDAVPDAGTADVGCVPACGPGQVCVAGVCFAPVTDAGTDAQPADVCVGSATDPMNCGRCGNVCPPGAVGPGGLEPQGVCVGSGPDGGGVCAVCPATAAARCGDTCANLLNDPANCRVCGHACGMGQSCIGGTCA